VNDKGKEDPSNKDVIAADKYSWGNLELSRRLIETMEKMYRIPDDMKITGVLSAWNIGAQNHMLKLGLPVDHMAAGGSDT